MTIMDEINNIIPKLKPRFLPIITVIMGPKPPPINLPTRSVKLAPDALIFGGYKLLIHIPKNEKNEDEINKRTRNTSLRSLNEPDRFINIKINENNNDITANGYITSLAPLCSYI